MTLEDILQDLEEDTFDRLYFECSSEIASRLLTYIRELEKAAGEAACVAIKATHELDKD